FDVEIPVGQRPPVTWLALPDERRLVPPRGLDVAIDAVHRDVDLAADEPLRVRRLPLENLAPLLEPVELFCLRGPEGFRVAGCLCVQLRIGNESVLLELA